MNRTVGRLAGLHAFLDVLDRALPEYEWADNESLKHMAEDEGWEWADFEVERQVLNDRFRFWVPRFTAYSVMTFLYSIVETQLAACAEVAAKQKQSPFKPSELRGQGVEAAARFLEGIGVFSAQQDKEWPMICDLRDLRHLIVHRGGLKGEADKHRKTALRLAKKYDPHIEFPDREWSWYGEVWISIPLCRDLIDRVERFLDRVFQALKLPPRSEARIAKGED